MEKIILTEADFRELQTKLEEITEELKSLNKKDPLNEKWLDNQDVCLILKISTRTLQTYRDKGILPFSQISNKIYYKASDIEKHLENNYVKAW
jgi:5-bromo-4-chloroindolyl phosphate hydrolysis protein